MSDIVYQAQLSDKDRRLNDSIPHPELKKRLKDLTQTIKAGRVRPFIHFSMLTLRGLHGHDHFRLYLPPLAKDICTKI